MTEPHPEPEARPEAFGFRWIRRGATEAVVDAEFAQAFESLGLADPAWRAPEGSVRYRGRAEVHAIDVPGDGGSRAVVRAYRHGSLSGRIFGKWFAGPSRAFRELELAHQARQAGVPVPQPLAAVTHRIGPFYRALYVSEEVAGAKDLAALLEAAPADPAGTALLRRASRACAEAVRSMHDAGFFHADLNLKNLIVRDDGTECEAWIVDWDLSRRAAGPLPRRRRLSNLMRLDRSARKFASRGLPVPVKERLRFLKTYFACAGVPPPTRAEFKAWAAKAWVHSWTWRGPGP